MTLRIKKGSIHLWILVLQLLLRNGFFDAFAINDPLIGSIRLRDISFIAALVWTVYVALFLFYNSDSFIYTTGITVRSLTRFKIDLYRYAIGFVGSALVIWVVYILYQKIESKAFWLNRGLTYCGQISLTIYIIDCLLNSYVLPRMTNGFTLNYGIVFVETIVVMLICISIDYIIKKVAVARRVLLGTR